MKANARYWILLAMLAAATVGLYSISHGEAVPTNLPLKDFPRDLQAWHSVDSPVEARIIDALQVDDYLSRTYFVPGRPPVGVWIAYYKSQRTGQTIHSPKNCLPGAGWRPAQAGRMELPLADGRRVQVNSYIVEKGVDRALVLYWYQSHGRIIASEYWAKIYMVVDAIRMNRTDAALVRVTIPLPPNGADAARQEAISFTQDLCKELGRYIPS